MNASTVLRSPLSISGPQKLASTSSIPVSNGNNLIRFTSNFRSNKFTSSYHLKLGVGRLSSRNGKSLVVRASKSSNSFNSTGPIAPLQLESPVGQFLSQILVSHPHLVPAAVEQQLEQLQNDFEVEKQKEEPSASGTDIVLYRRIAEVKANERRKALEEILYTLVVQKFMDKNISLIPSISPSSTDPTGLVDVWPSLDEQVEEVHSPEAYEMIQNHLALILGSRSGDTSVAQISKLRVGQVYAASVMFGYFLRRIDQRFQLEKAMKILPEQMNDRENEVTVEDKAPMGYEDSHSFHRNQEQPHPEVSPWASGLVQGELGNAVKPSRLRSYVMAFDAETLARYATIRSKEAVSIIEKHTEALFGKPEIAITPQGTIDPSKDEHIKIGFGGLKRLVLEAVTFGSILWDVESYVDSRHHLFLIRVLDPQRWNCCPSYELRHTLVNKVGLVIYPK